MNAPPPGPAAPSIFRKSRAGAPPDYYTWEALGLEWLGQARTVGPNHPAPVPNVLSMGDDHLDLPHLPAVAPHRGAAERFGRELAATHLAGAAAFGEPPPGWTRSHGFIADLDLPVGSWRDFGPFYAEARIVPYVEDLLREGRGDTTWAQPFRELCQALHDSHSGVAGPPVRPVRLHGDLWHGNVLWATDADGDVRGWLIDPAAHGGHPETDLAMLALFGAPHIDAIEAGYCAVNPLAAGWRSRRALHQVHPLLVHAVLFAGGYLDQARTAARAALRGT